MDTPLSEPYLCLPFVHLCQEQPLDLGPVQFWPSADYTKHIAQPHQATFKELLNSLEKSTGNSASEMTCVSVSSAIDLDSRPPLLIDALSLLYFAAFHRDLYMNTIIPPYQTFTKFIPIHPRQADNMQSYTQAGRSDLTLRESARVRETDPSMLDGFGAALSLIYSQERCSLDRPTCDSARRLVRAVRIFTHGFGSPFENIFSWGLQFPHHLFKAEDFMYLSSSFEGLLDLDPDHPASDFKFKSRRVMGLQYSRSVDIFWSWVNGFYALKNACIRLGADPDCVFRGNPNFEVSYLYLGVRLFIFLLYHFLEEAGLIAAQSEAKPIGVDRCELVVLFWTERQLLSCIESNLSNWKSPQGYCIDHRIGRELMRLYGTLYRRFVEEEDLPEYRAVRFIPTPTQELAPLIEKILSYRASKIDTVQGHESIEKSAPPDFWDSLERRLQL